MDEHIILIVDHTYLLCSRFWEGSCCRRPSVSIEVFLPNFMNGLARLPDYEYQGPRVMHDIGPMRLGSNAVT